MKYFSILYLPHLHIFYENCLFKKIAILLTVSLVYMGLSSFSPQGSQEASGSNEAVRSIFFLWIFCDFRILLYNQIDIDWEFFCSDYCFGIPKFDAKSENI